MLTTVDKSSLQPDKNLKYWALSIPELFGMLDSRITGLSESEALDRKSSEDSFTPSSQFKEDVMLLLRQFKSPLALILIIAVIISSALQEYTNSIIILAIVLFTGLIGFWQERSATKATQKLLALVEIKSTVLRNNTEQDLPLASIVNGDVVLLNAGDIVPGDCRLIDSKDLHVNEAALTGESFPREKQADKLLPETALANRTNCVFLGTSIISGKATALIVATGSKTEFGTISASLGKQYPETPFESGIKKFGYLLMKITLVIALIIVVTNVFLGKPIVESFLFSLALALGMTPELLPAIVTITLSAGAKRMAEKKVIVKRLESIQNLGSINVLCADKTGTVTEGVVKVIETVDPEGTHSDKVKQFAYLNALFESGFTNPLDEALRNLNGSDEGYSKQDEVPYDFIRKRLSVVVSNGTAHIMITKGSVHNILEVCNQVEIRNQISHLSKYQENILNQHEAFSSKGYRTIGIALKDVTSDPVINKDDEKDMTFLGFIILSDPPKENIADSLQNMKYAGILVKLITGDNQFVAAHLSKQIGLESSSILTGQILRTMSDEALVKKVAEVNVYAETEPYQKARIITALRKAGYVVGYIGDGINDVSAMRAADVSVSVDGAVDVAKETADIVLMEKDLNILKDGVYEGRRTFINTMKYIFITSSANFGNMFSMAIASIFLPFLPLLPKQVLLTNFLTDIPAMALPQDEVDEERIAQPTKWNPETIKRFMIVFGIESSFFDLATFFTLIILFKVNATLFQTSWFIESVATEILILMIIRTHRSVFRSQPGRYLLLTSLIILVIICVLPYFPFSRSLGFVPMPAAVVLAMIIITFLYCLTAEITKRVFFKRINA